MIVFVNKASKKTKQKKNTKLKLSLLQFCKVKCFAKDNYIQ